MSRQSKYNDTIKDPENVPLSLLVNNLERLLQIAGITSGESETKEFAREKLGVGSNGRSLLLA